MTIRRERNGWRAYTRVAGKLHAKRFPAGTPWEAMEGWASALRARPPEPPEAERLALEFWQAYQPKWVVGLAKTAGGWKVQVALGVRIVQKRFKKTASLVEMLRWRDACGRE